jgi:hypothetical protein
MTLSEEATDLASLSCSLSLMTAFADGTDVTGRILLVRVCKSRIGGDCNEFNPLLILLLHMRVSSYLLIYTEVIHWMRFLRIGLT